jgi:hypothetical protein
MHMKHTVIIATAVLFLSALTANARPAHAVLEDGREVAAEMLTLPSMVDGTVAIQGCAACKRLTLTISRNAQFFIGKQEVSFADLKRHLHDQPKSSVLVVSPINQKVVTRISASAADVK